MKFVCNSPYSYLGQGTFVIEADSAGDAAAAYQLKELEEARQRFEKREDERIKRLPKNATAKRKKRREFNPDTHGTTDEVVVLEVETGKIATWAIQPPPTPPRSEWTWREVPDDEDDEDEWDDEDDD